MRRSLLSWDTNPTAIIYYVAKTSDMCENPTVRTASWSACGSCKVSTEKYYITIPDDECGNSALEEIKQAFPELEITDYGTPAACQHSFQTTVYTNMLCDECDKVFEDSSPARLRRLTATVCGRNWSRLRNLALTASAVSVSVVRKCYYLRQSA